MTLACTLWCPKYRRQVLSGQVGIRLRELIDAKAAHSLAFTELGVAPKNDVQAAAGQATFQLRSPSRATTSMLPPSAAT